MYTVLPIAEQTIAELLVAFTVLQKSLMELKLVSNADNQNTLLQTAKDGSGEAYQDADQNQAAEDTLFRISV